MNLAQLARQARLEVDAIRASGTTSGLWIDEEVYAAINTALESAYRIVRLSGSDLLAKHMKSTDSAVDLITESYDPGSLQLVSGTIDYTLPPDLVNVINILPLTSGYDGIRFRPLKTYQKIYADQRTIPNSDLTSVNNGEATIYYVLIGQRTIRFVPTPQDTIDVELVYNYRPPKLMLYSTGTIATTGANAIVTGSTTEWLDVGLRTPAEWIVGTVSTAVDLGLYYPTISSIDTNTQLTMTKTVTVTHAPGTTYRIAMVPAIPVEYHAWLAQMAAALMYRKVSVEVSDKAVQFLEKQLMSEVQPEFALRDMQESALVEPYDLP